MLFELPSLRRSKLRCEKMAARDAASLRLCTGKRFDMARQYFTYVYTTKKVQKLGLITSHREENQYWYRMGALASLEKELQHSGLKIQSRQIHHSSSNNIGRKVEHSSALGRRFEICDSDPTPPERCEVGASVCRLHLSQLQPDVMDPTALYCVAGLHETSC